MSNRKRAAAFVMFLLLALSCAARAETRHVEKYDGPEAIPQALRMLLDANRAGSEDDAAAAALEILSSATGGALAAGDVKRRYGEEEWERRNLNVERLINTYDINHDLSISKDEMSQVLAKRQEEATHEDPGNVKAYFQTILSRFMEHDKNKDKLVSRQEMEAIPASRDLSGFSSGGLKSAAYLDALLKLDPDRDGNLTAGELDRLARRAFRAADSDSNGILSPAEREFLQQRKKSELAIDSPCRMPAPDADARIVYIGTQSGHGLSQYTVAGPYMDTGVAPVEIAPDAGKIHVIASGMNPLIWAFSGMTSLVSGVSVFGDVEPRNDKVLAGVTGISPGKVYFASSAHCLEGKYDRPEDDDDGALQASLAKIFGRGADIAGSSYSLRRARIAGSSISFGPAPDCTAMEVFDPPIPQGFDADTWFKAAMDNEDRAFYAFGSQKVVSPVPVEMYLVLPGWAGIAQLVHDGAIKREGTRKWQASLCNRINKSGPLMTRAIESGGIYKIVKNIPYFPAMETPGPHYVIARGTKMPKGFPKSCVTEGDSGKVLRNAEDCKGRETFHR